MLSPREPVLERRRPIALLRGLLVLAFALTGCALPSAESSFARVELDGTLWQVLVAGPDGMRGRTDFGTADGMLFDLRGLVAPGEVTFVMDGVSIPLAIAWFGPDGVLVGRDEMLPCGREPCPRHGPDAPFRWALEAPTGAFDQLASDAVLVIEPGQGASMTQS